MSRCGPPAAEANVHEANIWNVHIARQAEEQWRGVRNPSRGHRGDGGAAAGGAWLSQETVLAQAAEPFRPGRAVPLAVADA